MKSKLIAIVLVLLLSSGFAATGRSSAGTQPQAAAHRLIISEYGTLLDILDANGQSRFGKLSLEGYRVRYQTKGKIRSVFAVGPTQVQGLQPGQVTQDGQYLTITVKTTDKRLAITSYFSFDEATKALVIRRSVRNLSDKPVGSLVTQQYLDAKLIVSGQPGQSRGLVHRAQQQITVGGDEDCEIKECLPVDPICIINCPLPGPNPTPRSFLTKTRLGRQIVLRWNPRILTQASLESTAPHQNEENMVMQVSMNQL